MLWPVIFHLNRKPPPSCHTSAAHHTMYFYILHYIYYICHDIQCIILLFEQEAILLVLTTVYFLYSTLYVMYYITFWTGSHTSAAHHNLHICQAYLTRLSCYWLHWTIALLSKSLSTQISDNTQRCRVKYSCQQVKRLQKRISHRLECTQIAKARISPSCSSSPLSPWAERVPFFASQCFKDNSKLQR